MPIQTKSAKPRAELSLAGEVGANMGEIEKPNSMEGTQVSRRSQQAKADPGGCKASATTLFDIITIIFQTFFSFKLQSIVSY